MTSGSNLRILISVAAYLKAPDFGGPVTKVALLAEALAARGHAVTVVAADYGPNRSRVPTETVVANGYTSIYVRALFRYRWIPVMGPHALSNLAWDFDVVHVCGLRDGVGHAAIGEAHRHRTPYVIEPLGMAPARLRNESVKKVFDRLITRRQLRQAATVIFTSRAERDAVAAEFQLPRVVVRPNPIPGPVPGLPRKAASPDGGVHVVFVGRICRTKNLAAFLTAVEPLANVRVTLAGPDDNDGTRQAIAPIVARMRDRVVLSGHITANERDALIADADICVLPSITENFGNFAVEAAGGRRPVIVTTASGVAEFLGDAAVVVDPTVAALREAVVRLAADPALRDRLADAAYAKVTELAPRNMAATEERIYREALRSVDHDNR